MRKEGVVFRDDKTEEEAHPAVTICTVSCESFRWAGFHLSLR